MIGFLLSLLAFAITITIIVTIHEAGHFWAARLWGVRVDSFSIGMGKVLWRYKPGETEYRVSLLPIGGYVSPLTITSENEHTLTEAEKARSINRLPLLGKIMVLSAGVVMNLLLALVIVSVLGVLGREDLTTRLAQPPETSQAYAQGVRMGDRVLRVNGERADSMMLLTNQLTPHFGERDVTITFERPNGDIYDRPFSLEKVTVEELARLPVTFSLGLLPYVKDPIIAKVVEGMPAQAAGIQPFERIYAVNGQTPETIQDAIGMIRAAGDSPVKLIVGPPEAEWATLLGKEKAPNTTKREVTLTPQVNDKGVYQVGVVLSGLPETTTVRYDPWTAVTMGYYQVRNSFTLQLYTMLGLTKGEVPVEQLSGPIGIANSAGKAIQAGAQAFWEFVALISVAIAFMNLIPLPALDGGQILIAIAESIFGEIPERVRNLIFLVSFGLLGILMIWVMNNDLARLGLGS